MMMEGYQRIKFQTVGRGGAFKKGYSHAIKAWGPS